MNMKHKFSSLSHKNKKIIAILVFAAFLIFCAAVGFFVGVPMVRFFSEPEKFRLWVSEKGFMGKIAFVFMMIFQVVIALVPGEPLEIGAGYAFGGLEGTLLCVIGITLGSLIVFFLVRKFGVPFVEIFFPKEKINSLKILKSSKKRNLLIFLVFFLPGTPKDLLTYFVGLTDIKFINFLLIAALARLPSVITSTMGGDALGVSKYKTAIIVLLITVLVSVMGWILYKVIITKRKVR